MANIISRNSPLFLSYFGLWSYHSSSFLSNRLKTFFGNSFFFCTFLKQAFGYFPYNIFSMSALGLVFLFINNYGFPLLYLSTVCWLTLQCGEVVSLPGAVGFLPSGFESWTRCICSSMMTGVSFFYRPMILSDWRW